MGGQKEFEEAVAREERDGTEKVMAGCLWWFVVIMVIVGCSLAAAALGAAALVWRWVLA